MPEFVLTATLQVAFIRIHAGYLHNMLGFDILKLDLVDNLNVYRSSRVYSVSHLTSIYDFQFPVVLHLYRLYMGV